MGLYKSTDQSGQPLNLIYAEDVGQLIDVLTGQRDAGALSLLAPLAAPAAPSVSLSSGGVTGTGYQWGVYWITGVMDGTNTAHVTGRTPYGTLTAGQALSSQQATVSISSLTVPTGAIGWGVARNKSGGGTWYEVPGSEQFLTLSGSMPASFVDDTADSALVTTAPTSNGTGTTLAGSQIVGGQLDYAQITSTVTGITATSEGSATSVITGNSVGYDGGRVAIEVFVPITANTVFGAATYLVLFEDSTVLGRVPCQAPAASIQEPAYAKFFRTPSVGAHTYVAKAYVSSGSASVGGGAGGATTTLPAFLRVTRA